MPFHVSFFFELRQKKLGGWSENFWQSGTDLSVAKTNAKALGNALWSLKGDGVRWDETRVSDAENFRNVDIDDTPVSGSLPASIDSGDWADFVSVAGLLKLTADKGVNTKQWMKALCDGDIRGGARWLPRAASVTRFNAIASILTNASNGWRIRTLDPANKNKRVTNATNAGVITCTGHGLASGDVTRLSRIKGNGNWNGLWTVLVTDANTFSLVSYVPPAGVTVAYIGGGFSRKQASIYSAILSATITQITKHNTGRPRGLLSGRRTIRR